jgi:hypothetical protein
MFLAVHPISWLCFLAFPLVCPKTPLLLTLACPLPMPLSVLRASQPAVQPLSLRAGPRFSPVLLAPATCPCPCPWYTSASVFVRAGPLQPPALPCAPSCVLAVAAHPRPPMPLSVVHICCSFCACRPLRSPALPFAPSFAIPAHPRLPAAHALTRAACLPPCSCGPKAVLLLHPLHRCSGSCCRCSPLPTRCRRAGLCSASAPFLMLQAR